MAETIYVRLTKKNAARITKEVYGVDYAPDHDGAQRIGNVVVLTVPDGTPASVLGSGAAHNR